MAALRFLLLMLLGPWAAGPALAQTIAVQGATVIDVTGARDIPRATVLIKGDRIVAVGSAASVKVPAGARLVQGEGKFLIPALVDGHVHFFQSGGLYTRPDILDLTSRKPYGQEIAELRARLPDTLGRYVEAGVLTAIDMGGPMRNLRLRDEAALRSGGPRIYAAGPIISPYQPPGLAGADPPVLLTPSVAAARIQAAEQIQRRADIIKFGMFLVPGETLESLSAKLAAAAVEARRIGAKVAVHATELETARAAVKAGADILVHSIEDREVDDAFVALLKERGTVYVPSMIVGDRYSEIMAARNPLTESEKQKGQPDVVNSLARADSVPPPLHTRDAAALKRIRNRNLARLHDAAVPILFGTDAGNIGTLHAVSVAAEMEEMVAAGMPPRDVLASATIAPARMLGQSARQGSVAPGRFADLVLLDRDPRADIGAVRHVHAVISRGKLFRPLATNDTSEAMVVQRQLEAYNSHDVEAFAATYHGDIELSWLTASPPAPFSKGLAALKKGSQVFFAASKPRVEVIERYALGRFVIDRERVRMAQQPDAEAAAIYLVEAGRIRRVWFAGPAPGAASQPGALEGNSGQVVDHYLAAMNRGDLRGMRSHLAADVQGYELAAPVRRMAPDSRSVGPLGSATVMRRMILGNHIVDVERIEGKGREAVHRLSAYLVVDGRIKGIWRAGP